MLHTKHTARHNALLLLLALAISLVVTLIILTTALSLRGLYPPVQWEPAQFSVLQKNPTSLQLKASPIPANTVLERYAFFSLSGTQLQPSNILIQATLSNGTSLSLKAAPESNAERVVFPITLAGSANSALSSVLSNVQIIFQGERSEGASLLRIELEPRPGALSIDNLQAAHQALWHAWTSREGLNVYSAHFIVGGEKASYISSPVLAGLLWLVLSLILGWLLTYKRMSSNAQLTALALMGLLIWSLVDLRWQRDLWAEHGEDLSVSASAPTHAVDTQAERIRRALSSTHGRIIILSPEAFDRLRLRYALLPLNTHAEVGSLAPLIPQLRTGDTLILVLPQDGVTPHFARNQITSGAYTLDVKTRLIEPRIAVVTVLAIKAREPQDRETQP